MSRAWSCVRKGVCVSLFLLCCSRAPQLQPALSAAVDRVTRTPPGAGALALAGGEFRAGLSHLSLEGAALRLSPPGAPELRLIPKRSPLRLSRGVARGGSVVYPAGDAALSLTPHPGGVKEDIVLTRSLGDALEFSWAIDAPGLTARLDRGAVSLSEAGGKRVAYDFPAPFVRDASGREHRDAARYELRDGELLLHASGLAQLEYPISIDPTVVVHTTAGFLASGQSEGNVAIGNAQVTRTAPGIHSFGAFTSRGSLPRNMYAGCSVTYGGRLYAIDAQAAGGSVFVATPNSDGTTGGFTTAGTLPPGNRAYPGCAAYNGYLYIAGGYASGTSSRSDVFVAPIAADGTLGAFTATNSLPAGRGETSAVAANGFLYVLGGWDTDNTHPAANDVLVAPIAADGTVGGWTAASSFATPRKDAGVAVLNNRLYVYGGETSAPLADAQVATLDPATGAVGAWSATTPLPQARSQFVYGETNGTLFALTGENASGGSTTSSYFATPDSRGNIGAWEVGPDLGSTDRVAAFGGVLGGYAFVGGGVRISPVAILSEVLSAPVSTAGVTSWSMAAVPSPQNNPSAVIYNGYAYYISSQSFGGGNHATTVQYARIEADGSLTFLGTTNAPQTAKVLTFGAEAWNGYLYVVGGVGDPAGVQYAPINADGTLGTWAATSALNTGRFYCTTAVNNGYLYVFGGANVSSTTLDTVEFAKINANGTLGAWAYTTVLPSPRLTQGTTVYGNRVYLGGGANSGYLNEVIEAPFNADGTLGAWVQTTPVPTAEEEPSMAALNGVAYYISGYPPGGPAVRNVLAATINPDGTLGSWAQTAQLPITPGEFQTRVYNGRMYGFDYANVYISSQIRNGAAGTGASTTSTPGGVYDGSVAATDEAVYLLGGASNSGGVTQTTVRYAPIGANGALGNWSATSSMPNSRILFPTVAFRGYLYALGGEQGQCGNCPTINAVDYAPILPGGALGAWSTTSSFSGARAYAGAAAWAGHLYLVGGTSDPADVQVAPINADGSLGAFTETTPMQQQRLQATAVAYAGNLYAVGGGSDATVELAPIRADGTVGPWRYTASLPVPNTVAGRVFAKDGFLYQAGPNYIWSTPVLADGSLGGWTQLGSFGGSFESTPSNFAQSHVTALGNGYLYRVPQVITGVNFTAEVQVAPLLGPSAAGRYSRLFDFGAAQSSLNTINTTGAFPGATSLAFRTAGESGVFSPLTSLGGVQSGLSLGLNTNAARYLWVSYFFDDSMAANAAPDTSGAETISAMTVNTSAVPQTIVNPAALSFGSQAVAAPSTQPVYVTNAGATSITVGARTISGSADFTVSPAGSTTLGSGQTLILNVTFTPSSAGAKSGTLAFSTDSGPQSVTLSGTGTTAGSQAFTCLGSDQTFTVPQGVFSVSARLWGAGGAGRVATQGSGASPYGVNVPGGAGGFTVGRVAVSPGDVVKVIVGCGGSSSTGLGGYGGGGNSGASTAEGGGGGRSALIINGVEVITAGGGGGSTDHSWGSPGGNGGGLVGGVGNTYNENGCGGSYATGGGGTQTTGGAGVNTGQSGLAGQGGAGGNASPSGGGGGGGYFGGGGGSGTGVSCATSGGGGSGYIGDARVTAASTVGSVSPSSLGVASNPPPGTGDADYAINTGNGGIGSQDGAPGRVVLHWSPTAVTATLSTGSLPFGAQRRGAASPPLALHVHNGGAAALNVASATLSGLNAGDFAVTGGSSSIAAGADGSDYAVVFTPSTAGAESALLTILTDGGTLTATLTGTGTYPATLVEPPAIQFADTPAQGSSAAQSVYLTNTGTAAMTVSAPQLSNATDFSVSPAAGTFLGAGASATYQVVFTPSATGSKSASLSFVTDNGTSTVALTGLGLAAGASGQTVLITGAAGFGPGNDEGGVTLASTVTRATVTGGLGAWSSQPSFPTARWFHGSAVYNGFVYVAGGATDTAGTSGTTSVYFAPLNSDGTTGAWVQTASLLVSALGQRAVAYDGYLYVVGGELSGSQNADASVQVAKINANGTLGTFVQTTALPAGRYRGAVAAWNGYLYVAGGWPGGSGVPGTATTYFARFNADGTVGAWQTSTSLPSGRYNNEGLAWDGHLYSLGGIVGPSDSNEAWVATLDPATGAVGAWTQTTNLPITLNGIAAAALDGAVYVFGGDNSAAVYGATIQADGSLGSFRAQASLPGPRGHLDAVATRMGFLITGGFDGSQTPLNTALFAPLVPAGPSAWSTGTNLPVVDDDHCTVQFNGYAYKLAGGNEPTVARYAALGVDGRPGAWNTTSAFPSAIGSYPGCAVWNGRIYVLGGGTSSTKVYVSVINANGTLGAWAQDATALPAARYYPTTFARNGIVYFLGGSDASSLRTEAWYSKLNADGSLGAWTSTTAVPNTTADCAFAVYGNQVILAGGYDTSGNHRADVWYALFNANGSLGAWTATTPLPSPRYESTAVALAGRMVVFGGYNQSTFAMAEVESAPILATGGVGAWTQGNPLPGVEYNAFADTYNGHAVLVGGYGPRFGGPVAAVYSADLGAAPLGAWSTQTPLPVPRANYAGVATVQHRVYLLGGAEGGAGDTQQNDAWTAALSPDGTVGPWTRSAPFSGPRVDGCAARTTSNSFVLMGGVVGAAEVADVQKATAAANGALTWTTLATTLPSGRQVFGCASTPGFVYVTGGAACCTSYFNDVLYAPINGDGSIGSFVATTPLPAGRGFHGMVELNGYLYVIGGQNTAGPLQDVLYAKINANGSVGTWTATTSPASWPNYSVFASAQNGHLYLAAGDGTKGSAQVADVLSDGSIGAWQTAPALSTARYQSALVLDGNSAFVFGGSNGAALLADVQSAPLTTGPAPRGYYSRLVDLGLEASALQSLTVSGTSPGQVKLQYRLANAGGVFGSLVDVGAVPFGSPIGTPNSGATRYLWLRFALDDSAAPGLNAAASTINAISINYATLANPLIDPLALSFGNQRVGVASAAQTVYVNNTGGAPFDVTGIAASGDFSVSPTGTQTVAQGGAAALAVVFTPSAAGARGGNLTFNANGASQSVPLSGTGVTLSATLSASALSFGGVRKGSSSAAQTVSVHNGGSASLAVQGAALSGPNAADFSFSGGSTPVAAGGDGSNYLVVFTPSSAGPESAQLTVQTDAGPLTVQLSGAGLYPATLVEPASLGFPDTQLATSSASLAVYLSNTGTAALTVSAPTLAAGTDFSVSPAGGATLGAGASATWQVTFAPAALGPRADTLSFVTDNGTSSVALSGTGVSGGKTVTINTAQAFALGGNDEWNVEGAGQGIARSRPRLLGPWAQASASVPKNLCEAPSLVASNGFLYLAGGYDCGTSAVSNSVYYAPITGAGTVGAWQQTSSLAGARYLHASLAYDGYLYILGGSVGTLPFLSDVQVAKINADGSLGAFQVTQALPQGLSSGVAVAANGLIYYTGGAGGSGAPVNTVYVAPVHADGTLGAWSSTTAFTTGRANHAAGVYGARLYIAGGNPFTGFSATVLSDAQSAPINPDGTLGAWTATSSLPGPRSHGGGVVQDGHFLIAGGAASGGSYYNDAIAAPIRADGSLGAFRTLTTFTNARWDVGVASDGNAVFVAGGTGASNYGTEVIAAPLIRGALSAWSAAGDTSAARMGNCTVAYGGFLYALGGNTTSVEAAQVSTPGTVGPWTAVTSLPQPIDRPACAVANGRIYVIGGLNGSTPLDQALYAQINPNGTLGAWTSTSKPATARFAAAALAVNGKLYVAAGSPWPVTVSYSDVQVAAINADGSLAPFQPTASLAHPRDEFGLLAQGGFLYAIGGFDRAATTAMSSVERARINDDGTLGAWAAAAPLGTPRYAGYYGALDGQLYAVGGVTGTTTNLADGVVAGVNLDGSLTGWASVGAVFPAPLENGMGAVYNGRLYAVGGGNGSASTSAFFARATAPSLGWSNTNSPFTNPRQGPALLSNNGHLYALGGQDQAGAGDRNDVFVAPLAADGTVGAWTATQPFSAGRLWFCSFTWNGFMYLIGGAHGGPGGQYSDTQKAPLNPDGTLGSWTGAGASFPTSIYGSSCAIKNGVAYVMGGGTDAAPGLAGVYLSRLDASGNFGAFTATTPLPEVHGFTSGGEYGGYLYVVSGLDATASVLVPQTAYAPINADGTVGAWKHTAQLLTPRQSHRVVFDQGRVYVLQGSGAAGNLADAEIAPILSDGSLGAFQPAQPLASTANSPGAVAANSFLYSLSGIGNAALEVSRLTPEIPPTGAYSRLVNLGSEVASINSVSVSGAAPGAPLRLSYRLANNTGLLGAAVDAGPVAFNTPLNIPAGVSQRYLWLRLAMDDTAAVAFNADAPVSALGSITVSYSTVPNPLIEPAALAFGDVPVGSTAAARTVFVTNTGATSMAVTSPVLAGADAAAFATASPGGTLGSGQSLAFAVTFTPARAGSAAASLTFTAGGVAQSVALSGNGLAPSAAITCPATAFSARVGTPSSSQAAIVGNSGTGALHVSGFSLGGTNAADFSVAPSAGATVAAGSSATWQVTFAPAAAGTRSATLTFATDDAAHSTACTLSGTGLAPVAQATVASVNFGSARVGGTPATASVALQNTGNDTLHVTGVSLTGPNAADFAQSGGSATVLPGQTGSSYALSFTPSATGARSATLVFATDGGTVSVPLTGSGVFPALVLQPGALAFGSQRLSTASAAQVFVVQNTGTATSAVSAPTVTGDFSVTPSASTSLAAGASASYSVTFTPSQLGARSGGVSFTVDGGSLSASFSGTGVAPAGSIDCPSAFSVSLGSAQGAATVVHDTGTSPLAVSGFALSGADAADFSLAPTGGATVAAGGQASWTVSFRPSRIGAESAALAFATDAGTLSCSLAGTGTSATADLSATSLAFGSQRKGTTSSAQTVTLVDNGNVALAVSSVSVSGPFAASGGAASLAASGGSATWSVTFTPVASGPASGSLTLVTSAGTRTVALSGTGLYPVASLAQASLAFGSQRTFTTSAPQTAVITNTGTDTLTFSAPTLSGGNAADFSFSPSQGASLAPGASQSYAVTFTPRATGARAASLDFVTEGGNGSVALSGSGAAPSADLSCPGILSAALGSSASGSATLGNSGSAALGVSGFTLGGNDPADFSLAPLAGATVAPAGQALWTVTFKPSRIGAEDALLTFQTDAGSHACTLQGTGQGATAGVSPQSLAFGDQRKGTTSSAQAVTLTNSGNVALTISSAATSGPFAATGGAASIAAGGSATWSVTFAPPATGAATGALTLVTSAGTRTVALGGNGIFPAASIAPSSLGFGAQRIGAASAPLTVAVTNSGTDTLALGTASLSGANGADFSVSPLSSAPLAPGASATFAVTFTPAAGGARSASLDFTGADVGALHVPLSGSGIAPSAAVSPGSLAFGDVALGATSTALTVTLSNGGTAPLHVSGFTLGGSAAFSVTPSSQAVTLPPGASQDWSVRYTPAADAQETATLTFQTDAGSPAVSVSGHGRTGVLVASAALLDFGPQRKDTVSAAQAITLSNSGDAPIVVSGYALAAGPFSVSPAATPITLLAGGSATWQVTFAPLATGLAQAQLTFATDHGPQAVALQGTGTFPLLSVAPLSLAFGDQRASTPSQPRNVTLTNTGTDPLHLGAPSIGAGFSVQPASAVTLPAGVSATYAVTFAPAAAGSASSSLTFSSDVGPVTVPVAGRGTVPGASLSATALAFGDQRVGTSSASSSFTLTSTGTDALHLSGYALSGAAAFTVSPGSAAATLLPGDSLTFAAVFAPTAPGAQAATVTLHTDTGDLLVSLGGTGRIGTADPSATSLIFAGQRAGTTSAAQALSIANHGNLSLSVAGWTLSPASAPFSISPSGPSVVTPGAAAAYQVSFAPAAAGPASATLTFVTDVGAVSVALSGAGLFPAAALTPSSLFFGGQRVGRASAPLSAVITNTGTDTLAVSAPATTGDFAVTPSSAVSLGAGAAATWQVTFTPAASGARTGSISFTTDAGPLLLTLGGSGTLPGASLSTAALAFGDQPLGTASGAAPVKITSTGTDGLVLSGFAVTGADAGDFAVSPSSAGLTLLPSAQSAWAVTFRPSRLAAESATLTFLTDAGPLAVALSGTGRAGVPSLSAQALPFGTQRAGTSAQRTLTLTNTGNSALSLSGFSLAGSAGFSLSPASSPATLAAAASASWTVTFAPVSTGAASATVSFATSAGTVSAALSGAGVFPAAVLSPSAIAFGSRRLGAAPASSAITLANAGTDTLGVSGLDVSGAGFTVSPASGTASLGAGASALWTVSFGPTAAGPASGSVTFHTDDGDRTVSLTGTGLAPQVSASASSLAFGSQRQGVPSAALVLTLSNAGNDALAVTSAALSGANAADYTVLPPASSSVPAGGAASWQVVFRPLHTGASAATLLFTTDAGSASVALSGAGVFPAPAPAPAALAFGPQGTGTTSPAQTLTLRNDGDASLQFSAYSFGGAAPGDFEVTPASGPVQIAAGQSAQWTVRFKPSASGARAAVLLLDTDAGELSVALSGTGIAQTLSFTPLALDLGSQRVGATTAAVPVSVTNNSANPATLTGATFSGPNASEFAARASGFPLTLAAGASGSVQLTFTPQAAGARSAALQLVGSEGVQAALLPLSGTGLSPVVDLSPQSHDFGVVRTGTTTAALPVVLTNTGTGALTVIGASLGGSGAARFILTAPSAAQTLQPQQHLTLGVAYAPTAVASDSATLSIVTDAPAGTVQLPLTGQGSSPAQTVGPLAISFDATRVGDAALVKPVTVANTGAVALVIQTVAVAGAQASDFTATLPGALPLTLAPAASATLAVGFRPGAAGQRAASLTLATDAGPASVALSGLGMSGRLHVSAQTVDFGPSLAGGQPRRIDVALLNDGDALLRLRFPLLGGASAAAFSAAVDGPQDIPVNGSATVHVSFAPSAAGDAAATLTLASADPGVDAAQVALKGSGVSAALTASQTALDFGVITVGGQQQVQLTLTNKQAVELVVGAVQTTQGFLATTDPLPVTLRPGQGLTVWVTFAPTAVDPVTGKLLVHVEGQTAPALEVALSGSGTLAKNGRTGCGCNGTQGGGWLALQALAVLALVRRRKAAHVPTP